MQRFKQKNNSFARSNVIKPKQKSVDIPSINPKSAGIDIGSRSHFVAISSNLDEEPVREFSSTTVGLLEIAAWLKAHDITTVAMESTGSYWVPVYEILESHGLEVYLVNAKSVKNAPGRKTDVLDCQWIQKLHSLGLLSKSFRPKDHCLKLRALTRQHSSLIEHRSPHVQHMQKSLHEMNIQLATHIRDITGDTGIRIIKAILDGERDEMVFASLVDPRCKNSPQVIAESLRGNYREEHLFTLKQSYDLYFYYSRLIKECENEIQKALEDLTKFTSCESLQINSKIEKDTETPPISDKPKTLKDKKKKKRKDHFQFPISNMLEAFSGVDITEIPGIDQPTALKVLAEIGGAVDAWPTASHFASWLGLCPGNKISGGKILNSKTKRCPNKVSNLLRMAANGLWNAHCYLGAFLRRMKSRLGGPKAITATAHKMAVILYTMIKERKSYIELGEEYYERTYRERRLKALVRQANEMGLMIVPIQ